MNPQDKSDGRDKRERIKQLQAELRELQAEGDDVPRDRLSRLEAAVEKLAAMMAPDRPQTWQQKIQEAVAETAVKDPRQPFGPGRVNPFAPVPPADDEGEKK